MIRIDPPSSDPSVVPGLEALTTFGIEPPPETTDTLPPPEAGPSAATDAEVAISEAASTPKPAGPEAAAAALAMKPDAASEASALIEGADDESLVAGAVEIDPADGPPA